MFFGPIMDAVVSGDGRWLVWFICSMNLACVGAINPLYAFWFVVEHPVIGLVDTRCGVSFGDRRRGVVCATSGISGASQFRSAWLCLVLPALIINYFAQGALVLANPHTMENPFYLLFPAPLLPVRHCTGDARNGDRRVRRSLPAPFRLPVRRSSSVMIPRACDRSHIGNPAPARSISRASTAVLLLGVLLLVGLFRTSSALASAYGVAVTTTMVVDGILGFIVIWKLWKWKPLAAALLMMPLIMIDTVFLTANLLKLLQGAWVPLVFGASIVILIITWRRGTSLLAQQDAALEVPLDTLIRKP